MPWANQIWALPQLRLPFSGGSRLCQVKAKQYLDACCLSLGNKSQSNKRLIKKIEFCGKKDPGEVNHQILNKEFIGLSAQLSFR